MHISFDIFHAFDARMIAVGNQSLHSVEQAVDVGDAARIFDFILQRPQASTPVLVVYGFHG